MDVGPFPLLMLTRFHLSTCIMYIIHLWMILSILKMKRKKKHKLEPIMQVRK